ncbi:alpha/beta hydrolase [Paraburkholderia rhizosphaerae]|uniref:Phospholipase/carboxylesterase n=1 Tax=Paraburkholderia rhizosphaerae TaxID=480658 RepID=A0A4R8LHF0_9BURK|nr:esterase [Paraburkholderia rhizosphaerae]TDY42642.1 phospholipase/carboxylesterase [Paraburkholderia rhizosphaerae]
MFDPSLLGRLSFTHAEPSKGPLPPGRHRLGIADDRDAILFVPDGISEDTAAPLLVMFHGAGGFPEKVLPYIEGHAQQHRFLVLAPHSTFPTWDIVIGGNGPDLERLGRALTEVTSRYQVDRRHLAFAGFSDGASYALSIGVTNGDIASHVIAFSGGFFSVFMQEGTPKVFIAHGLADEQLPIATSGRVNAAKLKAAGYDVQYVEFNGPHAIQPSIVDLAVEFFLKERQ